MPRRSDRTRNRPRRRGGASRSFRGRILIVTEDTKSSLTYFEEVRASLGLPEENVTVEPGDGSDPVSVVETAVESAYRAGSGKKAFDRVFVVVDRDQHGKFDEAMTMLDQFNAATSTGTRRVHKWAPNKGQPDEQQRFELVLSDPCFELWLLLHFTPWTSAFAATKDGSVCAKVQHELKRDGRLPNYDKGASGWWDATRERYDEAKANAEAGVAAAERTGNTDPSTTVYEVVEAILSISRRR